MGKNLDDGESVEISDEWNGEISCGGRGVSNEELFYASGNSFIKTKGIITIKRQGDFLFVEGVVTHEWIDQYNWHPGLGVFIPGHGRVEDADLERLQIHGKAKEYPLRSSWEQQVSGRIKLDGKKNQIIWKDK